MTSSFSQFGENRRSHPDQWHHCHGNSKRFLQRATITFIRRKNCHRLQQPVKCKKQGKYIMDTHEYQIYKNYWCIEKYIVAEQQFIKLYEWRMIQIVILFQWKTTMNISSLSSIQQPWRNNALVAFMLPFSPLLFFCVHIDFWFPRESLPHLFLQNWL